MSDGQSDREGSTADRVPRSTVVAGQALPDGFELRGYRIEAVLGAGGFGITYRARNLALENDVALKEYFPADYAQRDRTATVAPRSANASEIYKWGLERFLLEARTLARFRHAGIVHVNDYFEANGTAYIVLNYERGQSVKHWLRNLGRAPTQAELDRIVVPLLDALEQLHKNQLLHRDIAPDNIIIREDGSPVLIDFGAARRSVGRKSQAITGIIKHGYSPPEQYATGGDQQGPWSDIYALGATLYRAITGELPPEAALRLIEDAYVKLAGRRLPGFRPSFLAAIDWSLGPRPSDRPRSIADWRRQLLKDLPTGAVARPPRVADEPARPRAPGGRPSAVGAGGKPVSERPSNRPAAGVPAAGRADRTPPAGLLPDEPPRRSLGWLVPVVAGLAVVGIALGVVANNWFAARRTAVASSEAPAGINAKEPQKKQASKQQQQPEPRPQTPPQSNPQPLPPQSPAPREEPVEVVQGCDLTSHPDDVIRACTEQIRRTPRAARAYNLLGRAYRLKGDHQKAIDNYRRAIEIEPTLMSAKAWRGLATRETANPELARDDFNAVLAQVPQTAEEWNARGIALLALDRAREALEAFERAITIDQWLAEAIANRGRAHQELKDYERALSSYRTARGLVRGDAFLLVNICATLVERKDNDRDGVLNAAEEYGRAVETCSEAISVNARAPRAHLNRAVAQFRLDKRTEAINDLGRELEINPSHYPAWLYRGQIHQLVGNQDRALQDYSRAKELRPDEPDSYLGIAGIHHARGDFQRTIAELDRIIARGVRSAEAFNLRGVAKVGLGDQTGAIADYDEALKIAPDRTPFRLNRARAYAATGNREAATADFQAVLARDPNNAAAREGLAGLGVGGQTGTPQPQQPPQQRQPRPRQ